MPERQRTKSRRRTLSSLISFEHLQQDMTSSPSPPAKATRIVKLPTPASQPLDPNDSGVAFDELEQPLLVNDVRTSCCYASQAFAVLSPCQHSVCRDCVAQIIQSVQTDQTTLRKMFTCWCGQKLAHLEALAYDPVTRLLQLLRSRQPPQLFSTSIEVLDAQHVAPPPLVALPRLDIAQTDPAQVQQTQPSQYLASDCFVNCRFPIIRVRLLLSASYSY